ncbi:MAG TPA: hypothetical protein VIT67_07205 [Povalibacter sp.]
MADYLSALGPLGGLVGGGAIPADATPEAIKRRRAVQAAIAAQKRKFPTTLGEGMTYLGEAVGERLADDRLTEAEKVMAARDRATPVAPVVAAPVAAAQPVAAAPVAAPAPAPAGNTFGGKPYTEVPVRKSEADPALLDKLAALITGGEVPQENPTQAEALPPQEAGGQPNVQLAALGGTGGTMTDAPPPGAGFRPPAATVIDDTVTPTDIKPMPVKTAQINVPPAGVLPGSDASMFASPAFRPMPAPAARDTSQGITPAPRYVDPGPEPRPTGMTPGMLQNWKVANDPMVGEGKRAEALALFTQQKKVYDDAYTRSYNIWKEKKAKFDDPASNLSLEQAHLANEKTRRELVGEGWRPASEEKLAVLAKRGMVPPAGQIVYENRKGELKFGPTPPATTNINLGEKGENKAVEAFHTQVGKDWAEQLGEGMTAADDLKNIAQLRVQAAKVNTGPEAVAKQWLGKFGVKTEGISDIEAMSSTIKRLIPAQRLPGSGPTSDFDARGFEASLPALMNTREGNLMIMDTMEGLARNKMQRAEIVTQWATGELKMGEAIKKMSGLQSEARAMSDRAKAHVEASGVKLPEPVVPKAGTVAPPPEAIKELLADPSKADFFDKTFGAGSSQRYLGR